MHVQIADDANGNTLTKSNASGTTQYGWDVENRLTNVMLPNGGGALTFNYDPFGRRVRKIAAGIAVSYVYDGSNLLNEIDPSGSVLATYTQAGIDERLAERRANSSSYYQEDGLDSTTSLTNATGTLVSTYTYDSYGRVTGSTGTLTNPLQYTGRELDQETSIFYYRSRYYDETVGRFLSEDRLQFAGDGPNLYSYTLNNPVNWVDPMGTSLSIPGPPPPPTPPGPPGPAQLGGFTYNKPAPGTGRLAGAALAFANCMGRCLATYFVVTGGSECTPDGRHVPGGVPGSKHCTNQAIDIRPDGQDQKKVFCCALQCGAQYIQDENDHWHIQLTPGRNGGSGLLPKKCECGQ